MVSQFANGVREGYDLRITDIRLGTGRETVKGALIKMHYEGFLDNGQKFDSSLDKGRVFQFVFGAKRVIQGMDLGLIGMREGGTRTLFIPAHLAYGARSVNGIPPHSNLTFHVELLEVLPRE
jgi:FKBP-type peptidyl-prolyl cis-trans isomerase